MFTNNWCDTFIDNILKRRPLCIKLFQVLRFEFRWSAVMMFTVVFKIITMSAVCKVVSWIYRQTRVSFWYFIFLFQWLLYELTLYIINTIQQNHIYTWHAPVATLYSPYRPQHMFVMYMCVAQSVVGLAVGKCTWECGFEFNPLRFVARGDEFNALVISRVSISVLNFGWLAFTIFERQFTALVVNRPLRKPNCPLSNPLNVSRKRLILLSMTFSRSLPAQSSTQRGLYKDGTSRGLSLLRSRTWHALFQIIGKWSSVKHLL